MVRRHGKGISWAAVVALAGGGLLLGTLYVGCEDTPSQADGGEQGGPGHGRVRLRFQVAR